MLMVLFQLGPDRFAVESRCVVEIVPRVDFKAVPRAPDYVAGLFNYRDCVVPVLDLCQLTQNRPCHPFLSSRIILIDYGKLTGLAARAQLLGLLAERVTDVCERPESVKSSPVRVAGAAYLGDIFFVAGEMNQCLEPAALLPESLREMLFSESGRNSLAG